MLFSILFTCRSRICQLDVTEGRDFNTINVTFYITQEFQESNGKQEMDWACDVYILYVAAFDLCGCGLNPTSDL